MSLIKSIIREKLMLLHLPPLDSFGSVGVCLRTARLFSACPEVFELKPSISERGVDALEKSWLHFHFVDLGLIAYIVESSELLKWVYAPMPYSQSLGTSCWNV